MLLSNWIGTFIERSRFPSLRSCFFNQLFHTVDNLLRVVLRLNNCLAVFFVYFHFCTGRNTETLSHLLWENDSTF